MRKDERTDRHEANTRFSQFLRKAPKVCNLNTAVSNGVFTDSFKVSSKAVLLHNGNKYPSVPLARAVHMKETYETLQVLLQENAL